LKRYSFQLLQAPFWCHSQTKQTLQRSAQVLLSVASADPSLLGQCQHNGEVAKFCDGIRGAFSPNHHMMPALRTV
jgi:hypothetical protein